MPDSKLLSRRAWLAGGLSAAGCRHRRASGFDGYAFIANSEARSVAAVDLSAFAVASRIRLEGNPTQVLASPLGRRAFVLIPDPGLLCEIDSESLAVRRVLRLHALPQAMRPAPDGNSLWILCASPAALLQVPLDLFRVTARRRLPGSPGSFDISRNGRLAVVALPANRSIALADLERPDVQEIALPKVPRLLRFRWDWEPRQVIVGNAGDRTVTIADIATRRVMVHLPLPVEPSQFCMKNDGGQIFVSGAGMDAVAVLFPFTTEIGESLLAGKAPGHMAISPFPQYLFVSNPGSGNVTILDIQSRKLVGIVTVGLEPGSILFTPDSQYALVLNRGSGDVSVIRLAAIRGQRSKTAPLFTMIPVGSRPLSGAIVAA